MPDKTIQIEKLLNDLRNNYIIELPARFNELDNIILTFLASGKRADSYEHLYRIVHSLKGSSGTHNLHIISTICHEFENAISLHDKNLTAVAQSDIDNWLKYVDLLKKSLSIITSQEDEFTTIEKELESLRASSKNSEFKYHCLLVAPTKLQKQICESIFTNNAVSYSVANDGYEALGRLLTAKYDFLITNHEISVLNGIALIAAMRISNTQNKDIQSVLMTSKKTLSLNRYTDPDFILVKDSQLAENLATVVHEITEALDSL